MVMEKQLKLRNKILKILPKAAAAVAMTFQNPPFSPGRDHKSRTDNANRLHRHHQHHGNKGFSGQITMIPQEARRKPNGDRNNIDYQEPTSPKISCMGQIKSKKKQIKKANASSSSSTSRDTGEKKHASTFQRMLLHGSKPKSAGRKSNASAPGDIKDAPEERAPHMSQMKRFASGRDTFANFDWKAHQVAPEEIDDCYSDEDRVESDGDDDDKDFKIPFSAPILVGTGGVGHGGVLNLKPRKEINLWKRRTMAPPRPLQLTTH